MINNNIDKYLDSRPAIKDNAWFDNLANRKKEEASFHDYIRSDEAITSNPDTQSNLKFYKITKKSKDYVRKWLREHVIGKVFLDYACGEGRHSEDVLKNSSPRILIGLDISPESVKMCQDKTSNIKTKSKVYFIQGDCENTELPDNSIDVILCSEMLHHLNLKSAFKELYRICDKGGLVFCCEALGINPIIQWYRNRTPNMRTEYETHHILTPKAFDIAKEVGFVVKEVKYWHLFAIPSAFLFKHKILFQIFLKIGNFLDSIFLKIPGLQKLAWQFTFILQKQ